VNSADEWVGGFLTELKRCLLNPNPKINDPGIPLVELFLDRSGGGLAAIVLFSVELRPGFVFGWRSWDVEQDFHPPATPAACAHVVWANYDEVLHDRPLSEVLPEECDPNAINWLPDPWAAMDDRGPSLTKEWEGGFLTELRERILSTHFRRDNPGVRMREIFLDRSERGLEAVILFSSEVKSGFVFGWRSWNVERDLHPPETPVTCANMVWINFEEDLTCRPGRLERARPLIEMLPEDCDASVVNWLPEYFPEH